LGGVGKGREEKEGNEGERGEGKGRGEDVNPRTKIVVTSMKRHV